MKICTPNTNQLHNRTNLVKQFLIWSGPLLLTLFVSACQAPQQQTAESSSSEYIFYPESPAPPRLQYLTSMRTSLDVSEIKRSSFGDFIGGKKEVVKFPQRPYGIDIHEGGIYVADIAGASYVVFDLVNKEYREIRGTGPGSFAKPVSITIDDDGTRYIADASRREVLVYSNTDQFMRALGNQGQFKPVDVAIQANRLFVADTQDHEIEVLDKVTGELLYKITSGEAPETKIYYPISLAIRNNFLYVNDSMNFRIKKYSLDGTFIRNFGKVGVNMGTYARPKGIAVDASDNLFVVDTGFENVQIHNADYQPLMVFGEPGMKPDNINMPADIVIDYQNIDVFKSYVHPDFDVDYLVLVSSQYGENRVNVWGVGKLRTMKYPEDSTD